MNEKIDKFIKQKNELLNELMQKVESPSHKLSEEGEKLFSSIADEDYFLGSLEKSECAYQNREQDIFNSKLLKRAAKRRYRVLKHLMITSAAAVAIYVSFTLFYNNDKDIAPTIAESTINYTVPTLVTSTTEIELGNKNRLSYTPAEISADNTIEEAVKPQTEEHRVVIPRGYTYDIVLSDGSMVTLNSGSELIYPNKFDAKERVVQIKGEAYFNIMKSDTPFIVESGDTRVKVYGTEFNIRQRDNGVTETVLVSGSVGVTPTNRSEIMITPNQMFRFNAKDKTSAVIDVDVRNYISWLKAEFDYNEVPLDIILEDIERWYGVKITNNTAYYDEKISLFAKKREIKDIMQVLEKILNVNFINEGRGKYVIE